MRLTTRRARAGLIAGTCMVLVACGDEANVAETGTGSPNPNPPAATAPTVSLSASPASITGSGMATLTWSSTNATSCSASGTWSGSKATSGSESFGPIAATSNFTLACTGAGGSAQQSATVTVTPVAANPPVVSLSANPATVATGSTTTLTWSSSNATSCTASGGWSGAKALSGSEASPALTTNTSFNLSCSGAGGTAQQSVAITVQAAPPPPPPPAIVITATPASVVSRSSAQISWSTTNATSCSASGAWSGARGTAGAESTGALTANATYTLSCTGSGGNAMQSTTVTVTAAAAPTLTFTATPTSVAANGTATFNWNASNVTSCTASGAWSGAKATSGSEASGPIAATSTYTLACTGTGGTVQRSVTVSVTPAGGAGSITGRVDSGLIDSIAPANNMMYVFAGNVTPDDDDGDAGDPVQRVVVAQDENACTFGYAVRNLAAGEYTVAFTKQGAADRLDTADTLAFTGVTTVTVGSSGATRDIAASRVLRVGPGRTYSTIAAAAAAAAAGDVIEVDAGEYPDDVIVWRDNSVVVRGVGGRAHVRGNRVIPFVSGSDRDNGKGLWVVRGTDMRVENIEFSGARVVDQNGAGIRNEGRNLTICNSVFRDSENGILGGAYGQLTIEYSTFFGNGQGDVGRTHNLYIDEGTSAGDRLVFRHNNTYGVSIGHLLKTRARENWILYNRIMDETNGSSSYAIDVPNGGLTYIIGNVIQQGVRTDNSAIIAYGAEGLSGGRSHEVYAVNNTLVNDRGSGTYFAMVGGMAAFRSVNNLFVGSGTLYSGFTPQASNNLTLASPAFVDRNAFNYRLTASSAAVNAGVEPGSAGGVNLAPLFQYRDAAGREARPASGVIDVGAYEYVP